jgi:hypothetical protein
VEVLGFDWQSQRELINRELSHSAAQKLLNRLASDGRLRGITKTPFFLVGVIALAKSEQEIPVSRYSVINAMITLYEAEESRAAALRTAPMYGAHRTYLSELACAMTTSAITVAPESTARKIVAGVSTSLANAGQLRPEQPADVIAELCDRHVLQSAGTGLLRFTHQRVQEFFAAAAVIEALEQQNSALLSQALNAPFWEDALLLAVGELSDDETLVGERNLLLDLASRVDLAFTCHLAGTVSVPQGAPVWETVSARLRRLYAIGDSQAHTYSLAAMIATGAEDFADLIWAEIENPNDEAPHRGYGIGLRVRQLGSSVRERIAKWSEKQRVEFIWDLGDAAENLPFVEHVARTDHSPKVRAAALATLQDWYGASEIVADVWINAPIEVKLEERARHAALGAWTSSNKDLTEDLVSLAKQEAGSPFAQSIGLRLRDHAGAIGLEAAKASLLQGREAPANEGTIEYLRRVAPDFLHDTAIEQALRGSILDDWALEAIRSLSDDKAAELADVAYAEICMKEHARPSGILFERASEAQIDQWLQIGLQLKLQWVRTRTPYSNVQTLQWRASDQALSHVSRAALAKRVLQLADSADYDVASWLVEVLERHYRANPSGWDVAGVDTLVAAFSNKHERSPVPSCALESHLCALVAHLDPSRYQTILIDGVRKELKAWQAWKNAVDAWSKTPTTERPDNPSGGNWFVAAFRQCGFEALPPLIDLISEPESHHTVLPCLMSIVTKPWDSKIKDRHFETPFLEHLRLHRQAKITCLQPDSTFQSVTDRVAAALVPLVDAIAQGPDMGPCEPWGRHGGPHQPWHFAVALSRVPSPVGKQLLLKLL